MKLVKRKTAKLGKEGGKWLRRMVDAAVSKDKDFFDNLKNHRALLSGEHWEVLEKESAEEVKMVINLANAHVRSLVPTLFFKNPSADCVPTAPQHTGQEETWNHIINNTLDKTGFAEEMKKVTMDAVVYPEGVMKHAVAWEDGDDANAETVQNPGPSVWLSKGAPINVRIAPAQLIVDHLVKNRDVNQARFIAVRYRKPLHEIVAHPIYGKNIDKSKLKEGLGDQATTGNAVSVIGEDKGEWDETKTASEVETDEQMVTIYEVWVHQLISADRGATYQPEQRMCVLLDGQDEPIRELEDWDADSVMGEFYNRFPVTRLVLNEVPDEIPKSELDLFKTIQIGINWLVSRITALVENDRLIYEVDTGKVKNMSKFRRQFYKGGGRILAEVNEQGALNLVQPSFVGRDNYTLLNTLLSLLQQVSGFGMNRRGGSGIRTATEASLVDQGTQIKTDEKVDVVSKFLIDVLFKNTIVLRNLAQKSGVGWVFRVAGDAGSVKWFGFTAQDVDWLPEVRLRVNSFRKMDSLQEMQKFQMLLQTAMQVFQIYGQRVRADVLFSRMLEAAGVPDTGKIIGDQDSQIMLQTLEIALLMAGQEVPVSPDHDPIAHIQAIDMFINMPAAQGMVENPGFMDKLMTHRQEHELQLQQMQEQAAKAQGMAQPYLVAGQEGESTPQSEANQETRGERVTGGGFQ